METLGRKQVLTVLVYMIGYLFNMRGPTVGSCSQFCRQSACYVIALFPLWHLHVGRQLIAINLLSSARVLARGFSDFVTRRKNVLKDLKYVRKHNDDLQEQELTPSISFCEISSGLVNYVINEHYAVNYQLAKAVW